MQKNKIGERLKKLRGDMEISQAKLGAILNIPQQTYDRWEQGKTQPDADTLIRLALYFDVTVDYLIGKTSDFYNVSNNETVATIHGNNNIGIIGGNNNKVKVVKK